MSSKVSSINPIKFIEAQLSVSIFSFVNPTGTSANGSFVIAVSGGRNPYKYSLNNNTFQDSNSFSGLVAGNYTIYVKDIFGNLGFTSIQLAENVDCGTFNGSIWSDLYPYKWNQFYNCIWNDFN